MVKRRNRGGRETHYKKRNGTHTHTHVIPRRNGGCYIMCVCDRVANNERCEKKERTERKGSSLLILIRNDKGKKPKKNQKKTKKGIHFHSRYGVGWWRGKRTLVAAFIRLLKDADRRQRETRRTNAIPMTTTLCCCEQRYKVCLYVRMVSSSLVILFSV